MLGIQSESEGIDEIARRATGNPKGGITTLTTGQGLF